MDDVTRREQVAAKIAQWLLGNLEFIQDQMHPALAVVPTELVETWHTLNLFAPENVGPSAPWEPGMFDPYKHEDRVPSYAWRAFPLPWESQQRGNGHVDYYDANRNFVVHVYFWDRKYEEAWGRICGRIREHYNAHNKDSES